MNAPSSQPVAAIDVGSNSVYLTLARLEGHRVVYLERVKDPARLAGEIGPDGRLSEAAIERVVGTLGRFARLAAEHGAEIRATATAAIRAARNSDDFLRRAREEAGIPVELISGAEEARLTYLGVLQGLPELRDTRMLCVDIGGGSTEVLCGRGGQPLLSTSVGVGSLVVTRRLLGPDPVSRAVVRRAKTALRARVEVDDFRRLGFERAVATSGSVQRLVRLAKGLAGAPLANHGVHRQSLTAAEVRGTVTALARARTQAARLRLPSIDPERADTLLGGALILEVLTEALGVPVWTVSQSALRTGLLVDTVRRRRC